MARILRGDIYWADLNPTRGHEQSGLRPVLIISHNILNERSGTVIVLALTSKPQKIGFPFSYRLNNSKLPKESWVKINQIRTLSVERLGNKISRADELDLSKIIEGLFEIVG